MPSDREQRIADFVEPFRVKPGSKVSLAKDFDTAFKRGLASKKEGRELLARGIGLLAEYQSRLYAQTRTAYSSCSRRSMPRGRTGLFGTS
jgi:hypothetical protein